MNKANAAQMAYIGKKPNSENGRDSGSWYTPAKYVEMARSVMGSIDIDPYSCSEANKVVKAKKYFTESDNALTKDWNTIGRATVWANPPYGRGIIDKCTSKLIEEYYKGGISQAIILVNNATETGWFQDLVKEAAAICLVSKRIAFYNDDNKEVSGNTRGQVFIYLNATGSAAFEREFSAIGQVFSK